MPCALLLACVCLLTGCRYIISEPYPGITAATIPLEKVPVRVWEAFIVAHPEARVVQVETRSFKGKVDAYRIWFRSEDGKTIWTVVGREGQPLPESWFPPPNATNPSSALDAPDGALFSYRPPVARRE